MNEINNSQLSVIVTAHNEGILAHKTMLAIFRAAKKLEEENISYEIIIHIDNGTQETRKYFDQYKEQQNIVILESSFGDPALSRNFAVEKASGEFIAVIDGDDLCSENWLIDSYKEVKDKNDTIARVNYVVTFGGDQVVITENKDLSKDDEKLFLLDSNSYASPFVCNKKIYQTLKQRKNQGPYAYEDWQLAVDAISHVYKQKVVPKTVLFYRRDTLAKTSVLSQHDSQRSTLSPTESLSFDSIRKISIPETAIKDDNNDTVSRLKRGLKRRSKEVLNNTLIYFNTFGTYRKLKIIIKGESRSDLPTWLLEEWKNINKIEKLTFPSSGILKKLIFWSPNREAGLNYTRITQSLSKQPKTIFFVPWLIKGGADKVFINTANEIAKNHPDWNIAMFQTLVHPSLWVDKLDKSIDFVDIAKIMENMGYEEQLRLMAMFVSQNKIERLIIGNSKFAYDFVLRYKKLIKHLDIKVYAFAFTELIDDDGRICDYIHEELPLVQDVVYKIVTDNTSIIDQLHDEHGIEKSKIFVHHQFLNNEFRKPELKNNQPVKVLWASRVAKQKVPEVLRGIGTVLSDDFVIDAYGEIERPYSEKFFVNSNINYQRPFNGIDDLPISEYDVFLYTSSADGMPNMLLEIGSKGLPIVSPDIGGVKDFIRDGETGIIVEDYTNIEQYITALEKMRDSKLRLKLAENAQNLLKTEFTKEKWENGVKEIFDK